MVEQPGGAARVEARQGRTTRAPNAVRGSLDGPCAARSPSLAVRARGDQQPQPAYGIAVLRAASQHEAVREVRQRVGVRLASGVEPGPRGNGRRSTRLSIVSRIEAIEGPLARHLSALEHPGRSIAARAHDCKCFGTKGECPLRAILRQQSRPADQESASQCLAPRTGLDPFRTQGAASCCDARY